MAEPLVIRIEVLNADEVVEDAGSIIEAACLTGMTEQEMVNWVYKYTGDHIKVRIS